jgi:hypothetical protein
MRGCHNIRVLIQSNSEPGIAPEFFAKEPAAAE